MGFGLQNVIQSEENETDIPHANKETPKNGNIRRNLDTSKSQSTGIYVKQQINQHRSCGIYREKNRKNQENAMDINGQ